MGKYLFKIKEQNRLTQTFTQRFGEAKSDLFGVACRRLKRRVEETLDDAGIEQVPGLEAAFADFLFPFEDLKTT
ncbi:hypothetical protein P5673_014324 [Acropora cervicornis]|uniref:Uncharacterized protein n=1 Tax=Acropora cervicornis TaxID=6130 RepID=A0AAD9QJU5_ACRCE|nr:hypothetical protein P5673_014324 [Acropora cervicornis]